MKNKILITGISGFIGSHLANISNDFEVYGIDIDRNYLKHSSNQLDSLTLAKYQIYRSKKLKNVKEIFYIDIRNQFEIFEIVRKVKPSVIVHLAALPLANLSFNLTQEAYTSIFNSTYNLLECIRLINKKIKFIYTSSSMVYGNFQKPIAKEIDKTEPISAYGSAKLAGEVLVKGFAQSFGIKSIIIRPSAVYGPSDLNKRVVQQFLYSAINNKKIKINDKDLVLDFTYVDDIAQGFMKSINYSFKMKDICDIFNITSSDPRSLFDLYTEIKSHYPHAKCQFLKREKNVPTRGGLDISKAKKILGYKPKYKFSTGIKKYIKIEKSIGNG
tara:strand:+ start:1567 stop:2553 length:987 start_codon:yes stop_codon:yes gene_type:complete